MTRKECYDYLRDKEYLKALIREEQQKVYTCCATEVLAVYIEKDKATMEESDEKPGFFKKLINLFR